MPSKCSVSDCDSPAAKRGMCHMHHARWLRHGDPLIVLTKCSRRGVIQEWINNLPRQGGECIEWPFAKCKDGYGRMVAGGSGRRGQRARPTTANRYICEKFNGPPPDETFDAAHECGRGHLGCVAPYHLTWKTRYDNVQDRHRHGTMVYGISHRSAKLTDEQVLAIRAASGTQKEIAACFGISKSYAHQLRRGLRRQRVLKS